jgi:hypothetical protein
MTEEDIKRMEVVGRLGKFLKASFYTGTASIYKTYWVLRELVAGEKPAVSNRLGIIQELAKLDPQLLTDLMPYFHPDSKVMINKQPIQVPQAKKESW